MKEQNMFEYNEETMHLGAVVFSGNASKHPKMSDQEWDEHTARIQAANDYYYSPEGFSERLEKIVRSIDDMKREYEEKDGMVSRDNLYLPEGVTRGWDVSVHGPVEFIN